MDKIMELEIEKEIMSHCLLPIDRVLELVPISNSQLWTLIRDEEFPLPVMQGRRRFWRAGEVLEYINDLPRYTNKPRK